MNEQYSGYFEGLVDIVEKGGNPAFLVKDNGNLEVVSHLDVNGVRLLPPPREAIQWLLPRAEEVLKYLAGDSDKQLYIDLLEYHKCISELPSEEYYDLLVAWDLHTYLLEKFSYSPYLYFFAVAERGKSRTGKGLSYVAYRGFRTETLNEAQIIRLANDCKATLFIDTKDLWKIAEKKGIQDVLLGRFEKGSKIPRVLYPEKGAFKDMVFYEVFGPTIIATNIKVDEILETRAIEINMPETDKLFDNDVKPELSLSYKERLVAFRARNFNADLPEVDKPVRGRLGDIIKPLLQIVRFVYPEREDPFIEVIARVDALRRLERSISIEAEIIKAVIELENKVTGDGKLSVEDVCREMNLSRMGRFTVNSYSIGRKLTAMGLRRTRMSDGSSGIFFDPDLNERLAIRYGVNQHSEASETSPQGVDVLSNTEDAEITEVSSDGSAD